MKDKTNDRVAKRGDWQNKPIIKPQAIPPPSRIWTTEDMEGIRRGYIPHVMEEKWFIFVENDHLFAHRSWTGMGRYEATFVPIEGGYVIEHAVVESAHNRDSDEKETQLLEMLILGHLTNKSLADEKLSHSDPFTNWELHVPSFPKEAFGWKKVTPTLSLVLGDITKQDTDAIVNTANKNLLGGSGVDGAIHRKAGPKLLEHCRTLGGCKTGQAKITPGFNLQARWIIHTVGPIWKGGNQGEPELLASCYRESLARADKVQAKTIAFPAISTGAFGYPLKDAAAIAIATVQAAKSNMSEIRFVAFNEETADVYKSILESDTDL